MSAPAFPVTIHNNSKAAITDQFGGTLQPGTTAVYGGMTLRDYFAAQVIGRALSMTESRNGCYDHVAAAACAYLIADALLAERESA